MQLSQGRWGDQQLEQIGIRSLMRMLKTEQKIVQLKGSKCFQKVVVVEYIDEKIACYVKCNL